MASQQFCLRWNNYQNNLLDVFSNLLSSEHFCDVTLACDGKLLKAHKMVLSACSTFFQEIFLNNPCKHPVVFIKDVKYSELHSIVEFMYRGEVNISQDQLSSLLKTAEALQVKGLAEVGSCEQSNESSQDESHKMSMQSIINNDDDNRSNVEKPKNSSRRSYPPSPKRLKTQRTETQSQEIIQQRIQTFHQSPAPSSQAQTDINDIVPPQEIELEDDVKPILIKNSPKSYTIDESNSNDLDMYSSYAEQPFEEPDGEPYGNVELTQIANNIDLDQNQSSSSSILPAAGNSTVLKWMYIASCSIGKLLDLNCKSERKLVNLNLLLPEEKEELVWCAGLLDKIEECKYICFGHR
ncbi:Protein bric-a-brac 2 [Nymphon striatum]|nr:Protein bric-a-brac 2 [Nymphon striatum]